MTASPRPWSVLLSLALLGLVLRPAQAQVRDTVELEELVVTADRTPTPLNQTTSATTVINGEELGARGIYFLEDALRQVPGAALVPTGSYGGTSSLFLRGGESDYTKVLVDGVPVNQPGGAFNFGTLSTDNIERIEIVRGPASVLYGSDAVTGVVNIITRRGRGPLRGEAASSAGTHGTWRGSLGASGGSETTAYAIGLSRYTTDGIYRFNSGYRSTVGSGALTVRPDARTDVTLTARTGDNSLHFPTDFTGAVRDSNQQSLQDATTLGLEAGRRLTARSEVRLFLALHSERDAADNRPDSPGDTLGFFSSQAETRTLRRSADVRGLFALSDRASLTAGAQAEFEDLSEWSRSESNFGGGVSASTDPPFDATRRNLGAYAQVAFDLGSRVRLNVGGRLDDNQRFGTHGTYRAGAVYRVTATTRARGSVGSAYKEPSLRENYVNSPFEVGNPDLEPESSRSWEVGLEQGFRGDQATLSATWFDQRFRNLIQYDGSAPPGTPTYQNVAKATSRGIEVAADLRVSRYLTFHGSYTWLHTRVDDAGLSSGAGDVFVEGRELIRRPAHSARVDARSRPVERIGLGLAATYVGSRDDVDFRPFPSIRAELPAYLLVDADLSVDLLQEGRGGPGLTGMLRVENLFDKDYDTVVGFRGRGRTILAGGRVGL